MARELTDNIKEIFRYTPLMMNSFSRLRSTDSCSRNQTADSGYLSSFASSNNSSFATSAIEDSLSNLYCSTPVAGLSINSTTIIHPTETPVHAKPLSHVQYSEDRIPCHKIVTTSSATQENDDTQSDVLSSLIKWRITPTIHKIFKYLGDEDLLNLCQVSDIYCQTVCDDQLALKRLSRFLITANQDGENRITTSFNSRSDNRGILRPIHNFLNVNPSAGAVWTIPSPLENIDLPGVPKQFKALVRMTKEMSEFQYVSVCHSCRGMVAVRLHHQQSVECSKCLQLSKRNNTRNRAGTKKKLLLFPTLR